MLKAFNSFQIVSCFAAAPFGIGWLFNASFPASTVAAYAGVVGYGIFFVLMCIATLKAIDD